MKRKILFCTGSFKTGAGGIASYAHDFVKSFSSQFEISILTGENYNKGDYPDFNISHLNGRDFSIENAKKLINIIRLSGPDIVINSSFPLLSLITPYIDDNIKVVTVSHFMDGILMWDAAFNGDYVDNIIALSSFGKANIIKEFAIKDTNKVSVVWNFMEEVTPSYFEKQNRKVLKIVYPGGGTYNKSSEIVCEALKRLLKTDLDFEFYWTGNTNLATAGLSFLKTKSVADCLPHDPRIKHIGSVDREISKELLANANIFLLPSRGEGFPITLIEAMRNGCIPVVSDAKHGSLDIISNGKNGFVVRQGIANDIVNVISDIIKQPDKYSSIYSNTYSFYRENLTEKCWHEKMYEILSGNNSHDQRSSIFDEVQFNRDIREYTHFLRKFNLMVKFRYLYLILYYRYVRFLI